MESSWRRLFRPLLFVPLASWILVSHLAGAATISVDASTGLIAVDGECSISEAIQNANSNAATHADCTAGSGTDTIVLTTSIDLDTLVGNAGTPNVNSPIVIEGGGNTIRRVGAAAFKFFYVQNGPLTIRDLTHENGDATTSAATAVRVGGAIQVASGDLIVESCVFRDNVSINGGAIRATTTGSTLEIRDCVFDNNTATLQGGGAVAASLAVVTTIERSIFRGNSAAESGGAIFVNAGASSISNSIISGNEAGDGGGLYVPRTLLVEGSTIVGNRSTSLGRGGGIHVDMANNSDELTLINTVVWGNVDDQSGIGTRQIYNIDGQTSDCVNGSKRVCGTYTAVQELTLAGTGNFGLGAAESIFVAPVAGGNAPTTGGNYHLKADSRLVDAGDDPTATASGVLRDIDGDVRPFDHFRKANGPAGTLDIGADEAPFRVVEVGRIITTTSGVTKTFGHEYGAPVAVAFLPTRNGGQPVQVRITDVTAIDMQLRLHEPLLGSHSNETTSFVVAEQGHHMLGGGLTIEAGQVTTSSVHTGPNSHAGPTVGFRKSISPSPVVVPSLNTFGNADFMSATAYSTTTTSFRVQQEAAETGASAVSEEIGWMAFKRGSGTTDGHAWEIGQAIDGTQDGVTDSPHAISFSSFLTSPDIVATTRTVNGSDGHWVRGALWSASTLFAFAEEDTVGDTEQTHADEEFGWAVFEKGATFGSTCFVESTGDTITDFSSTGASALQAAIDSVATGATLRVAGHCGGAVLAGGTEQTVRVDKQITIIGGFTPVSWAAGPTPSTWTTILSAGEGKRVIEVVAGGDLTLDNVMLTRGSVSGGAIRVTGGTALIRDSILAGNITTQVGAAVRVDAAGSLTLERCVLRNNSSGDSGGALYNAGTLSMTNCTVSNNFADASGGGLFNFDGNTTLDHVTFTENTCDANDSGSGNGGAFYIRAGSLSVGNSIVIGNQDLSPTGLEDCRGGGLSSSNGHNLFNTGTGCSFTVASDVTASSGLLGALADHGGFSRTHSLLPGSPALDASDAGSCPTTDQRGTLRPVAGGCDIGAFESSGFVAAIVGGNGQSTVTDTNFPSMLSVVVTTSDANAEVGPGVVEFSAPASGASLTSTSFTAATDAAGQASSSTVTANGTIGAYQVSAGGSGFTGTASFNLENLNSSPGSVPPSGVPLTITINAGDPSRIDLSWDAACGSTVTGYAVYEGTLGIWTDLAPINCNTGLTTSLTNVLPLAGDRFFVVVPVSASLEGSYGKDSAGTERSVSASACLTQATIPSCTP